jgi:hypothetical protein
MHKLGFVAVAYSLAVQKHIVSERPHISLLEKDNIRQGFFDREECKHNPKAFTGMRPTRGRLCLCDRLATE